MKRADHIPDALLVKYLLGEADEPERRQLDDWLQASEANRLAYEQFRLIWNQSKALEPQADIDTDAAWERFRLRVGQTTPLLAQEPLQQKRHRLWPRIRLAAAIILLLSCGWLGYRYYYPQMQVLEAGLQPLSHTLPDGSVVTLNRHARLRYPAHFRKATRDVSLSGECFFDISPDKAHAFRIHTADGVQISVVGTSFNVKSRTGATEVIVETGIVEVSRDTRAIRLNPGEKTIVSRDRHNLVREQSRDCFYNYYRTHEFVCDHTPLWRLANVLSEAYQVQIRIPDPRVRALELTTVFRDEDLSHILEIIADTFGLEIQREGSVITLQ